MIKTIVTREGQTNVAMTDSEVAAINNQVAAEAAEQAKIQYAKDRQMAYPSMADQLDRIYHDGIDAWKAEIKAIKDANPKPE